MFVLPEEFWQIKKTSNKGRGVFAKKDIFAGTVIGDYIGKVVKDDDVDYGDKPFYDLSWDDEISIVPNHQKPGIHLINHSCTPNCVMFPYKGRTLYISIRKIFSGEELTVSYLMSDPEEGAYHDVCVCGSPICRGMMYTTDAVVEKYEDFEEEMSGDFYDRPPVPIGSEMKLLDQYPKQVKDYDIYDIFGNLDKRPLISNSAKLIKKEIRKSIRTSGKCVSYPHLGILVYGIMNGVLVSLFKNPPKGV
ncbi:SET domain-containing protein [Candidatus Microgenomates bacterium]|nr:MAG: SET domain-containing protein [Candidatus Microgenomates bacterium]